MVVQLYHRYYRLRKRDWKLSRVQYIRTRTLCYSLHHFVLNNSIAIRPKNGQKSLQLRTYRVIKAKQNQPQCSFELIPVKESLLYM